MKILLTGVTIKESERQPLTRYSVKIKSCKLKTLLFKKEDYYLQLVMRIDKKQIKAKNNFSQLRTPLQNGIEQAKLVIMHLFVRPST